MKQAMDSMDTGRLRPLSEMDDYEVADGYPDIRGWTLYDETGREIGEVKDLLIDTSREEAVYATVDLNDRSRFGDLFGNDEEARIPLSALTLDEGGEAVRLARPLSTLAAESSARGEARGDRDAGRVTGEAVELVEERLEVEKAREKAGEVRIGKEVETETVRRQVPVEREEVIVERERVDRPIDAAAAEGHLTGRDDELVVPVYREEVEVTKRPVVAERLRIRKRIVQDTREVAAEVRKERATIRGDAVSGETGRADSDIRGSVPDRDEVFPTTDPEPRARRPR